MILVYTIPNVNIFIVHILINLLIFIKILNLQGKTMATQARHGIAF